MKKIYTLILLTAWLLPGCQKSDSLKNNNLSAKDKSEYIAKQDPDQDGIITKNDTIMPYFYNAPTANMFYISDLYLHRKIDIDTIEKRGGPIEMISENNLYRLGKTFHTEALKIKPDWTLNDYTQMAPSQNFIDTFKNINPFHEFIYIKLNPSYEYVYTLIVGNGLITPLASIINFGEIKMKLRLINAESAKHYKLIRGEVHILDRTLPFEISPENETYALSINCDTPFVQRFISNQSTSYIEIKEWVTEEGDVKTPHDDEFKNLTPLYISSPYTSGYYWVSKAMLGETIKNWYSDQKYMDETTTLWGYKVNDQTAGLYLVTPHELTHEVKVLKEKRLMKFPHAFRRLR